ncbi:MAG TPA: tetratricopeptide repeat protein [Coriobacteriia bacterium]|nr:tetratricopeptide repeat protein [Coriobacteriia bacterium]
MAERSAQLLLAESLARAGRTGPAVTACHQALRVDGDEALAHCLLAGLMLDEGFCQQAVVSATRAIEIDSGCVAAYLVLGLAYDRIGGMWDRSVLVWQELAEVAPDLAVAQVQLGQALDAAGFPDEAVAAWNRALELDPRDSRAIYDLALTALKREGLSAALPGIRRAGAVDPDQDAFYFALAEAPAPVAVGGSAAGRTDPAVAEAVASAHMAAREEELFTAAERVRTALAEQPDNVAALALAAHLYLKQEAVNEAMACALRALTLATHTPAAVYALGVAFAERPALAAHAEKLFAVLTKMAPGQAIPHVLLAESRLASRDFRGAGGSYRTALAIEPDCVRALFGDAAVALVQGDHSRAQCLARRAAFCDIERNGHFWTLYDAPVDGGAR